QTRAVPAGLSRNNRHEHPKGKLNAVGNAQHGECTGDDYPTVKKSPPFLDCYGSDRSSLLSQVYFTHWQASIRAVVGGCQGLSCRRVAALIPYFAGPRPRQEQHILPKEPNPQGSAVEIRRTRVKPLRLSGEYAQPQAPFLPAASLPFPGMAARSR